MSYQKGNCLVGQSGGPTAAINASLCGVIQKAKEDPSIGIIYGAVNGIEGLLKKNILNLSTLFHDEKNLELLKTTPAMYLGSCRYKLPSLEADANTYEQIFQIFSALNITTFFYIGGNDSMDTVLKLSQYAQQKAYPIKIIGIPKTIDNDLAGTDHTPGFGSAAKFVATTMLEIAHDSFIYDLSSITIVEIMGRNAGWLTAASALARNEYADSPDLIYLPEVPFSIERCIEDVGQLLEKKKNITIAVSEGIKNAQGVYIASDPIHTSTDAFGHAKLCGASKVLEQILQKEFDCKVRSIELNVLQRSAMHIASKTDLDEAYLIGTKAVEAAAAGITGKMMVFKRVSGDPYEISIDTLDIASAANHEKVIPRSWISERGNDVTNDILSYLQPLISGEAPIQYKNGLPTYLDVSHLQSDF